jgi:type IV secretory pathway VirB4 component
MADSYNMLILGFTGSGKSFFAKKEILNTYLNGSNDGDVIVIDPQGEYGKLCRSVGGEEVHIKGAGEHHINPLDISASYDENPVAAKVEFIRSMCAEMLSYTPDATQKTAIAVAAKRCYDAWLLSGDDGDIPTLNDFYLALCDYYNSEGGRLQSVLDVVKAVEFYVAGVDTLFQGHSNINTEASFISYDISELGEGIRPLAMLIILDSILNRMSRNRKLNRPTFVYIDEIHLLFQKEQTAQWIKKLWKTARKYKCCPCGLTQDCEDLLATDTGRAVLTNTAFVVLLKQQAINAGVLAEQLQLSARQLEYVTDTPPGEGLLCIQNASRFTGGVIPFEDHFPEDSLLFEICQTSSTGALGR